MSQMRIFHCTWPDEERFHLSRREEEKEVLKNTERLSHVKIFGQFATIDVAFVILSFLVYDYELICSLGVTSVSWFRLILETWPYVEISLKNIHKIPISVLIKTKKIRFCIHHRYSFYNIYSERPNTSGFFDHVFDRIDFLRITKLDFRDFSVLSEKNENIWETPRKIVFPNCVDLRTGHVDNFWDSFKYFDFPNLRILDCYFLDLLDQYAWGKNINFSKLNKLVIQMKDKNSRKFNRQKTDFDTCLSRLYELKENLQILNFQFSSNKFGGFRLQQKNVPYIYSYFQNPNVPNPLVHRFVVQLGKIFFQNEMNLKELGIFFPGEEFGYSYGRIKKSPLETFDLTVPSQSIFSLETMHIQCNPVDLSMSSGNFGRIKKLICKEKSSVHYRNLSIKLVIPKEEESYSFSSSWSWEYFIEALMFIISNRKSFLTEEKGDLIEIEFWINISPKRRRSKRQMEKKNINFSGWWGGENKYGSWKRVSILLVLKSSSSSFRVILHNGGNKKIDSKKFELTKNKFETGTSNNNLKNENILEDVERCVSKTLHVCGVLKSYEKINLYDSIFM